jgi:hypothetical protein
MLLMGRCISRKHGDRLFAFGMMREQPEQPEHVEFKTIYYEISL